ncbi:zinc finger protein basonuclin-2-like isoform X2 [Scomber scombrus]|uniref:Zinc finger protein basonuclin-2-like isoform X2 n=1 Tax=Scomber scombrus TaxID=13677 RepID=A0AAV1Q9J4_SCOSC
METLKLVAVVILSLGLIEADPWSEDWMLESTTSEPYTENITAHLGQDVTVDCQAPGNYSIKAVNWTRPDLGGRYVFYYRDGHMDPGNQHPSYKNRVRLVGCLLNCSSLSFIMLKVRATDYATYWIEIKYIDNGIKKEPICIVNLMPPGDPDGDHLTTSPTTMNPATASPTTMNLTTMNPATARCPTVTLIQSDPRGGGTVSPEGNCFPGDTEADGHTKDRCIVVPPFDAAGGEMRMSPDTEESVRCTVSGCSCVCFKPGSVQLRSCDRCGHSWVAHAMEKLRAQPPSSCGPVEVALPGLVFDLSSLVLYGAQAIPVRLKIPLDRLYSILTPEQVGHILHTLGWSLGDYVRGYMLQYPNGKVLDRWLMVTPEEELLILKQFLRFGETRPIVELMTLQRLAAVSHLSDPELNATTTTATKRCQSNISTFIEHSGRMSGMVRNARSESHLVAGICHFKKNNPADRNGTVHHFENFPGGLSLLLPFHFPSSVYHCFAPPTKDLISPSKLTQCLQRPSGTHLADRQRQDRARRGLENDPILLQSKSEPAFKIKTDPDKPNPARSLWHQIPRFHMDHELDVHRRKQENPSPLSPSLNSSLMPVSSSSSSSSSLHQSFSSSSSSPPKISQKLQGSSSSSSFHPLPSFSSSFLCSLPTSSTSFPSSLHPLPSSLCSLSSPSSAGSRKGRVCCGVCGKSFYDKGTLKIHYNAVHLKIKHRCTVAGCTMVFSSLRSRNRHSANPNPRLHTVTGKDAHTHNRNAHSDPHIGVHTETQIHIENKHTHTRICSEKETRNSRWQPDDDAHTLIRAHTPTDGLNSHTNSRALSPHRLTRTPSQDTNHDFLLSDLRPPTLPPPLLPAHSASSLGSPPSLAPLVVVPSPKQTEHCRDSLTMTTCDSRPVPVSDCDVSKGKREQARCSSSPPVSQQWWWEAGDHVPKKKPRKSSMPVKIEREKVERRRNEGEEEEECFVAFSSA